jgi:hypothetical protein
MLAMQESSVQVPWMTIREVSVYSVDSAFAEPESQALESVVIDVRIVYGSSCIIADAESPVLDHQVSHRWSRI